MNVYAFGTHRQANARTAHTSVHKVVALTIQARQISLHYLFVCLVCFSSSPKDMFPDFRERGKEREEDNEGPSLCERNISQYFPYAPWPGIKPTAFRCKT